MAVKKKVVVKKKPVRKSAIAKAVPAPISVVWPETVNVSAFANYTPASVVTVPRRPWWKRLFRVA